ncbi:hypothetical protein Pam4_11 [Pseudanabaena phage Pam4]|nr:hypothetical protein Pam4_11 [Pseudanabaena phage Pam4]
MQARFYVATLTLHATGTSRPGYADPAPIAEVVLRPVTRGEANTMWASSTPAGEFRMTIRGTAVPWFQDRLGQEVAITLDDRPAHETAN